MAVVDSQYLFRLIDVGAPGRLSDGGIFKDSAIGKRLEKGELGFPRAAQLPASSKSSPHVFIGDEAFQLRPDFMRPLPGSRTEPKDIVFNYRLSRARRCVENAFGILASRWRIYQKTIDLSPKNVDSVIKATCVLHNFLCLECNGGDHYCPPGYADSEDTFGNLREGVWRQNNAATGMLPIQGTRARKSSQSAAVVRSVFIDFFFNEGQVPWQWNQPGIE
ncbi:uncharacterized protein LOC125943366 [Dermacentor silvarum]|uniref:uncharacterized protein LOC125943366 n=1 Tax=Dermacentor silvarum TaxID=543639 RepID=UPI002100DA3F|nr:uncharacterized protein LOC125943366 [Dermacentor silvarum]